MSTTNRAFIRAYRHDTAQPEIAGGTPVIGVERRPEGQATAAQAAAPVVAVTANISGIVNRPKRSVPNAATEKRPLSSYIQRTQPGEKLRVDEAEQNAEFRPGTTVASFQWPAVCRAILQKCGPQLDQVTRLLWARAGAGNSLIGVFGLFCESGATTTTLCLASRAASRGRRVILGDANFRSPRVAAWLEAVPTVGWEDVLRHSAPLTDAVVHATDDNLDVLALGNQPAKNPQPLAGGLQATATAGILRHAYDLALLDLGPFFDPASQPVLFELVSNMGMDAALAVAGPEPADRRDLATIIERLDRSGCEFLGVIENRVVNKAA